jgi:deoxyribodipyrimidine photo-lyase
MKKNIFWFRRDLRIEDNTALNAALNSKDPVIAIFIFDNQIVDRLPKNDARINFIYSQLKRIDSLLKSHGSSLLVCKGNPCDIFAELIIKYNINCVFSNKDYEPYALNRDKKIDIFLKKYNIKFSQFKDQVIFDPHEILKDDGLPYTVYTAYKNKWLLNFSKSMISVNTTLNLTNFLKFNFFFPSLEMLNFSRSTIVVLDYNLNDLGKYSQHRDYPSLDSTSYLSVHLRFGTVSIRKIINDISNNDTVFLSELIWREFFMQILFHFPHVLNSNFKKKYDSVKWRNNKLEFLSWCEGKTGYPIVDAGMRQLNLTGYMHNRVRMIVAGFLCKHLLIDWKWGAEYFSLKLLDYELSSNNGNWQWAAGTGCDSAPYFRIFNPFTQQKKFDKDFIYIKTWIKDFQKDNYLEYIVDHDLARKRALSCYKLGLI